MTMTTASTLGGKTAAEWRAEAQRCRQSAADSWERSDTDGFLSQWASGEMATRYDYLASIAERGGLMKVSAFVSLETGEVIKGEYRETRYGSGYAPYKGGPWIFPSSAQSAARRDAANAKKGVIEVTCLVPALVNTREMRPYPDFEAEWVVTEEES